MKWSFASFLGPWQATAYETRLGPQNAVQGLMRYQLWQTGELTDVERAMLSVIAREWRAGSPIERDAAEFELVQAGHPYREVQPVIDRLVEGEHIDIAGVSRQPPANISDVIAAINAPQVAPTLSPTLAGLVELGDDDCAADLELLSKIVASIRALYHPARKVLTPEQLVEHTALSPDALRRLAPLTGAHSGAGLSLQNHVLGWNSFEEFLSHRLGGRRPKPQASPAGAILQDLHIDFLPSVLRWSNLGPYGETSLELSPLTVLVGANAAGKTSALQVISLAKDLAEHGLDAVEPALRGQRPSLSHKAPPPLLRHRTSELTLEVEGELHKDAARWTQARWRAELTVHPRAAVQREVLKTRSAGEDAELKLGIGHWNGLDARPEPLHLRPNQLALCEATDTRRHAALIALRQSMQRWLVALAPAGPELLGDVEVEEKPLQEAVEAVLGPVKLRLGYQARIEQRNGYSVPLEHAPRGVFQVVTILAYLLRTNPPTLLAIDEIENHLHADVLERLLEVLRSFTHRTRILLTTHSSHVLRLVDPSEVRLVRAGDEGSSIVRVDRDPVLSQLVKAGDMGQLLDDGYFTGRL
jgi:predicted ATPase